MPTFSFGLTQLYVPEDVLYEIFKQAVPDIDMITPTAAYHGPSRNQAPMSLTQTCRSWRNIANNSPLLWNRIYFKLEDSVAPTGQLRVLPRLEFLQHQLSLTRHAVLQIYGVGGYESKISRLLDKVFDLIFPTFPRWKSAYLSLPDISFARLAQYNIAAGAPNLESLCMTTLDATESGDPHSTVQLPVQLWRNTPGLQHLAVNFSLDNFEGPTSPWKNNLLSNIPFGQLTFLEIGGACDESITISELYSVLDSCSSRLVTGRFLSLQTRPSPDDALFTVQPIHMPYLEILLLCLCISDENDMDSVHGLSVVLHNFVKAPRLSSLALHHDAFLDVDCLVEFIRNSNCQNNLETLDLYDSGTEEDFAELLHALPSLKRLYHSFNNPMTYYADTGASTISQLTSWNPQTFQFMLCPRLEEITFDYHNAIIGNGKIFYELIKARLGNGVSNFKPHLKTLRLTRATHSSEFHPILMELRKLCSEPFNLELDMTPRSTYTNARYLIARRMGTYHGEEGDDSDDYDDLSRPTNRDVEVGYDGGNYRVGEYNFHL